jgi:hypothetical protein
MKILRGLKFTSGFHRAIFGKYGLEKDVTITLRDGISMRLGNLYWGLCVKTRLLI